MYGLDNTSTSLICVKYIGCSKKESLQSVFMVYLYILVGCNQTFCKLSRFGFYQTVKDRGFRPINYIECNAENKNACLCTFFQTHIIN